ncbi:MAG: VTC domain-containing protein, partial [Adlercreutzia equolifaciens]
GIACDRAAWAYRPEMIQEREGDELFDSELRITFDDCLEYLDCHRFRSPWRPIIESSESVMEIKSAGPYPPWLVEILSAERIYPASFTKYGNAYQMATAEPRARNHRRAMRSGA